MPFAVPGEPDEPPRGSVRDSSPCPPSENSIPFNRPIKCCQSGQQIVPTSAGETVYRDAVSSASLDRVRFAMTRLPLRS